MALHPKHLLLIALAITAAPAIAGDVDVVTSNAQFGAFDLSTGSLTAIGPGLPEIALIAFGVILLLGLGRMRSVLPAGGKPPLSVGTRLKRIWILSAFILATVCSPAKADSIAITYSLTGTGTVVGATATTLTLDAQASGSVLSNDPGRNAAWNPVSYSDQSVLDLTTNLLNGNFTLTFADGDTLTGKVFEDQTAADTSPSQTGPFPQTLTFTGGTGEFAGATGSVSGNGFLGTTDFTVSGNGTVNAPAVPEPASAALFLGGLALLIVRCRRIAAKKASESRTTVESL